MFHTSYMYVGIAGLAQHGFFHVLYMYMYMYMQSIHTCTCTCTCTLAPVHMYICTCNMYLQCCSISTSVLSIQGLALLRASEAGEEATVISLLVSGVDPNYACVSLASTRLTCPFRVLVNRCLGLYMYMLMCVCLLTIATIVLR